MTREEFQDWARACAVLYAPTDSDEDFAQALSKWDPELGELIRKHTASCQAIGDHITARFGRFTGTSGDGRGI